MSCFPASVLRGRNTSLTGYSNAAVEPSLLVEGYRRLLDLAAADKLKVKSERIRLADVDRAWSLQASGPGRKLIVVPTLDAQDLLTVSEDCEMPA